MTLFVILSLVAILFQGVVIYYAYTLFKLVRQLKVWALAWGLFAMSMGVVVTRRAWSLYSFLHVGGPVEINMYNRYFEVLLLLIVSALWVVFVYLLKRIFSKYLGSPEGRVLMVREDVIDHRENVVGKREEIATSRENVVGIREVAAKVREEVMNGVNHIEVEHPKDVLVSEPKQIIVGFDKRTLVVENPDKVTLSSPTKVIVKKKDKEDIVNGKIVNGRDK
jgi:hypothetical protein